MKKLASVLIRFRNPDFRFDEQLDSSALFQFILMQSLGMLRATRLLLYGRLPRFMILGRNANFFNLNRIRWGRFVRLGEQVLVSGLGKKGVWLGNNVSIGAFSRIVVSSSFNNIGSHIRIGNNVGIGEYAYLGGAGGLTIEDDCIIGQYFSCHPENHNYHHSEKLIRLQGVTRKGIYIGKNCWIGAKVTILDGITIGEGCVIAAGAVVTRSVPSQSVAAGVPARIIRSRNDSKVVPISSVHFETGNL